MSEYWVASLTLLALAAIQNISFAIASRSRNRSSLKFHMCASFLSNGIWFITFRHLVKSDMSMSLFPWYCLGTVFGSLFGMRIAMRIEKLIGATTDAHMNKVTITDLEKRVKELEEDARSVDVRVDALEDDVADLL